MQGGADLTTTLYVCVNEKEFTSSTLSYFKFQLHLRVLLLQSGTRCSCKTLLDYFSILMRDVYLSAMFQRDYINLSFGHMQVIFIFKHPRPGLHLTHFHCLGHQNDVPQDCDLRQATLLHLNGWRLEVMSLV